MTRNSVKQLARIGALGVVAVLVLAACGSSDSASSSKDDTTIKAKTTTTTEATDSGSGSDLDGKAFLATGVEGYTPVAGSQLTLTFADGNLSVNSGCNTMTSAYEVDGDQLAWTGTPAATMMGCPDDLMNQDTWLIDFFTKGATLAVDGEDITLTQGDVVISLSAEADVPVTGTAWTLQSTISGDAASSVSVDVEPPTLSIADDGTAAVFGGCNNGSSTVEVTDTTLTFSPMMMTKMACDDVAMTLENAVVAVLDGEVDYTVEGNTLTIMNGTDGLVYTTTGS